MKFQPALVSRRWQKGIGRYCSRYRWNKGQRIANFAWWQSLAKLHLTYVCLFCCCCLVCLLGFLLPDIVLLLSRFDFWDLILPMYVLWNLLNALPIWKAQDSGRRCCGPMDLWNQSSFRSDTPSTNRKATRIRNKIRHGFCVGHFGLSFGDPIFLRKQHHDVGMLGPSEVSAGLVKAWGVQRGEGQRSAEILCAMTVGSNCSRRRQIDDLLKVVNGVTIHIFL